MTIPTRLIEQDEFDELAAVEEGDTIAVYKLTAIQFNPPRPEPVEAEKEASIRVMLLAVTEPRLYRDRAKNIFVVFPSFETLDYEAAQDMHPVKGAWAYRFAPYGWDASSPLSHATYLVREDEVPAFELGNTDTH